MTTARAVLAYGEGVVAVQGGARKIIIAREEIGILGKIETPIRNQWIGKKDVRPCLFDQPSPVEPTAKKRIGQPGEIEKWTAWIECSNNAKLGRSNDAAWFELPYSIETDPFIALSLAPVRKQHGARRGGDAESTGRRVHFGIQTRRVVANRYNCLNCDAGGDYGQRRAFECSGRGASGFDGCEHQDGKYG